MERKRQELIAKNKREKDLNDRIHNYGVDKLNYKAKPENGFKLKELNFPCKICLAHLNTDQNLKVETEEELKAYKSLELTHLKCGHLFHTSCLVGGWIQQQLYYCCPVCRRDLRYDVNVKTKKGKALKDVQAKNILMNLIK